MYACFHIARKGIVEMRSVSHLKGQATANYLLLMLYYHLGLAISISDSKLCFFYDSCEILYWLVMKVERCCY